MEADIAIGKMYEQNEKLRHEIADIRSLYDEFMAQHKATNIKKPRVPVSSVILEDEKEQEIHRINKQINQYKQQIEEMKQNINGNLNGHAINELRNTEKYLKQQIKAQSGELESLIHVEKHQRQGISIMNNAQDYPAMMNKLSAQLQEFKGKYKLLLKNSTAGERQSKNQVSRVVQIETKGRKLAKAIKESQKSIVDTDEPSQTQITELDVQELEQKLDQEAKLKEQEAKDLSKQVKELQRQIRNEKNAMENLSTKFKEKDQMCRLQDLKISEMKRAIHYSTIKSPTNADLPPISTPRRRIMRNKKTNISPIEFEDTLQGYKSS